MPKEGKGRETERGDERQSRNPVSLPHPRGDRGGRHALLVIRLAPACDFCMASTHGLSRCHKCHTLPIAVSCCSGSLTLQSCLPCNQQPLSAPGFALLRVLPRFPRLIVLNPFPSPCPLRLPRLLLSSFRFAEPGVTIPPSSSVSPLPSPPFPWALPSGNRAALCVPGPGGHFCNPEGGMGMGIGM